MALSKRHPDDDDDDKPAPQKKAKPSGQITSPPKNRPQRDDDDEDEVEQRPSLAKPASTGSSNPMLMAGGLVGIGALLLFCCGGVGVGGYFLMNREPAAPPKEDAPLAKKNDKPADGKEDKKDEVPPNQPLDKIDEPRPFDKKVVIKPPPLKPFNHVADASVSLLTEADSQVKNLVFAEQAPRAAVFFWDGRENLAKTVDVWDWQAGKRVNRIIIGEDPGLIHLSPMGTRLLVRERFPPRLNLWSVNDGKQIVKDWDPFPKDPKQPFGLRQELAWAYLLADDRVLSIARSGQFFLWNLTTNQPVYSIPAPKTARFLQDNSFAKMPQDFALSPDRRFLAINNKDGFDLYDAATGAQFGKTSSFAAEGSVGNSWSVAFNRAGTLLAFRHNLHVPGGKQQECITVWDIPSGKRKWFYPVATDFDTNGPIAFVGPAHLMVFDGNVFKGTLFGLNDGRYHRILKTSGKTGDRFGVVTPDERIWYVTRSVFNAPAFLVAVNLPEADLAQNPAPPVNQTRLLPMWGCYPTMVRRVNANEL